MHDIIRRPLITEKNTVGIEKRNEYTFEVAASANRSEIKKAIERLFSVKVIRVNTMVNRKEARRLGRFPGARSLWKKAIVKLKEGDKLELVAA